MQYFDIELQLWSQPCHCIRSLPLALTNTLYSSMPVCHISYLAVEVKVAAGGYVANTADAAVDTGPHAAVSLAPLA